MSTENRKISIRNKKAGFEYYLQEQFTAGLVLTGTEIKSIREGKANLTDSYCTFDNGELFVLNMHISEYKFGSYLNHEPKRPRKLLLTKKEIRKLQQKLKDKGITIIPVELFVNEDGFAKLTIAIAKGKKLYDKRETLKSKDQQREIDRHI
ncbi:MAG TPA: SsrA-binding protein SmpB [Bacteroidales bacterium]|nr:SsrA-binding protein SmpB [Bacteroidales bacterium]HPT01202.1 SsrA-binding protein SmpB [Bacteroidales bacterium]